METYKPPIDDILFVLYNIAKMEEIFSLEAFSSMERPELQTILEEAARFTENEILPTDRKGDQQGSQLNADGSITTPEGFVKAYHNYVEAGWGSVSFNPEWGGGGFPWTVGLALAEMLTSANLAFSLCPLLTQGSIHLIAEHGTSEQKAFWLPKLISGHWSGTMNLTEPQAGSDVGALTTRAERQKDGTYRIFGQKIFITWGEQDLTENIVHLVLARVADAPPGTKGISCFIVPKYFVGKDGSLGKQNDLKCLSIEKKMGIHASPTCVMEYGTEGQGAEGYIIGEENQGMNYMFTMMNNARLGVGMEGLAITERVYQESLAYAEQRLQGRRPDAPKGTQSPISQHPDVRRMLMTMKVMAEAMRCLVYYNSAAMDLCEHSDPDKKAAAFEMTNILTPLTKAWCTDMGIEAASLAIQVHGGAGFIEETGIAQHYRDIRIASIYEGTNGIQAIDLVFRKLPFRDGKAVEDLLDQIESLTTQLDGDLTDLKAPISEGLEAARRTSKWLLENMNDAGLAGATPYLKLLASVVAAWLMAGSALYARGSNLEESKAASARFFCHHILPAAAAQESAVMAGHEILEAYS